MTTAENPQQIRQEIEQTRADLSITLDEIGDRVSPGRIVQRRKDRVRGRWDDLRTRVMGSAPVGATSSGLSSVSEKGSSMGQAISNAPGQVSNAASSAGSSISSAASSAAGTVSSAASSVAETASNAPDQLKQQAQGRPLVAGAVALGAGLLAAAQIPPSKAEQQAG